MTEVEEKNAKETDKVESALQRAIHIDKIHGFLKRWLLVSFFIFAINYIVVYRSAFIGVPLSDREETSCAFLLLAFGILSWILCAAVSIYKEVRSVC